MWGTASNNSYSRVLNILADENTDDSTKGHHLVNYPPKSFETSSNIHAFEFRHEELFRWIPKTYHASIKDASNTTDLSTYINNAIVDVAAGGGGRLVWDGELYVESLIDILENVTLDGQCTTKFGSTGSALSSSAIKAGHAGTIVRVGTSSGGVRGGIKNCLLNGNGFAVDGLVLEGSGGSASWRCNIEGVRISGCSGTGLKGVANAWSLVGNNIQVAACGIGVECINHCNAWYITQLEISNCTIGIAWGTAASTATSDNFSIFGGTIQNCTTGVLLNNGLSHNLNLFGVYMEGNTLPIDIDVGGPLNYFGGNIDGGTTYQVDVANGFINFYGTYLTGTPSTACINFQAGADGGFIDIPTNGTGKPLYQISGSIPPQDLIVKQNNQIDEITHRHNHYLKAADSTLRVYNSAGTLVAEINQSGLNVTGYVRHTAALSTDGVIANTNTPGGATAYRAILQDSSGATIGHIPVYASPW